MYKVHWKGMCYVQLHEYFYYNLTSLYYRRGARLEHIKCHLGIALQRFTDKSAIRYLHWTRHHFHPENCELVTY